MQSDDRSISKAQTPSDATKREGDGIHQAHADQVREEKIETAGAAWDLAREIFRENDELRIKNRALRLDMKIRDHRYQVSIENARQKYRQLKQRATKAIKAAKEK